MNTYIRKAANLVLSATLAVGMTSAAFAADGWVKGADGRKYQQNGRYLTGWHWISDVKDYGTYVETLDSLHYFDEAGNEWTGTVTPDGHRYSFHPYDSHEHPNGIATEEPDAYGTYHAIMRLNGKYLHAGSYTDCPVRAGYIPAEDSTSIEAAAGAEFVSDNTEYYKRLIPPFCGRWEQTADGRWTFRKLDGSVPVSTWEMIDGKKYCFDQNGILFTSCTTPDGFQVNAKGERLRKYDGLVDFYNYGHAVAYLNCSFLDIPLTLEPTEAIGLCNKTAAEISAIVGEKIDKEGEYSFDRFPGVIFEFSKPKGTPLTCYRLRGPFCAFYRCSATDTITREMISEKLGVHAQYGYNWDGDQTYVTFMADDVHRVTTGWCGNMDAIIRGNIDTTVLKEVF